VTGAHGVAALAAMWVAMMAAMMLPSAVPMVRVYATVARNGARILAFLFGYVAIWSLYGLAAAILQAALLHGEMELHGPAMKGAVLLAAGVYQWTPVKHACLQRCRSPLGFFLLHWREGLRGAFVMGLRHGGYCVGCCWLLMLVLFAGGVMNLWLIALLAGLALAEKALARGPALAWISGVLLAATGIALVAAG
jgi:predicted metal-binding membrane protein